MPAPAQICADHVGRVGERANDPWDLRELGTSAQRCRGARVSERATDGRGAARDRRSLECGIGGTDWGAGVQASAQHSKIAHICTPGLTKFPEREK